MNRPQSVPDLRSFYPGVVTTSDAANNGRQPLGIGMEWVYGWTIGMVTGRLFQYLVGMLGSREGNSGWSNGTSRYLGKRENL